MQGTRPRPQEDPERIPPLPPPRTALGAGAPPPERRYLVARGERLIGYSYLECPIPESRAAAGLFFAERRDLLPVLPVFLGYRRAVADDDPFALHRFVEARDALDLRVLESDGTPLDARVDLISQWDTHTFAVHTTMEDPRYWDHLPGRPWLADRDREGEPLRPDAPAFD